MKDWTINCRNFDLFVWSFVFVALGKVYPRATLGLIYMQWWRQTQFLRFNGNVFPHVFFLFSPLLGYFAWPSMENDVELWYRDVIAIATNCDHIHIFHVPDSMGKAHSNVHSRFSPLIPFEWSPLSSDFRKCGNPHLLMEHKISICHDYAYAWLQTTLDR